MGSKHIPIRGKKGISKVHLRKMLAGLHKLYPVMNEGIFGLFLDPEWAQIIGQLRAALFALNHAVSFPITPKFHIILEHVHQWIQRHGRSLGKEAEHAGESLHHG